MKRIIAISLVFATVLMMVACGMSIVTCPHCGEQVENIAYCSACGGMLGTEAQEKTCASCEKTLAEGAAFCPYCGERVVSDSNNNNNSTGTENNNNNNEESENVQQPPVTVWLKITETNDSYKTVYFYDYNGNLRGERRTAASTGYVWSATEYILDDKGNRTELRRATPTSSTLGNYNVYTKYVYENTYDSNGRLFSVKETNSKTKKPSGTTEYTYDANGNIKEITEYFSNGSIDTVTVYENGRIAYVDHRSEDRKETYEYDSEGRLIRIVLPEVPSDAPEADNSTPGHSYVPPASTGSNVPQGAFVIEFTYDSDGNVASENKNGDITSYTYVTLEEYISLNKHNESIPEMTEFPAYIGSASCSYCSSNGQDYCIGHDCPVCNGAGVETCAGCHGTGKHAFSHLPNNACVVCYGSGTQICPNCDGARKKFYTS